MDTSHINSVTNKIGLLPDYPCCCLFEDLDFDPFPSSTLYPALVDALPCFNPSNDPSYRPFDSREDSHRAWANFEEFANSPFRAYQQKALEKFASIHSIVFRTPDCHLISLSTLKQYAVCFDEFFFEGRLLERCSFEWVDAFDNERLIGQTREGWKCPKHRQCHNVRILLLRPQIQCEGESRLPKRSLDRTLTTLLHEMSHAWVEIFGTREGRPLPEAIDEIGLTGHGKAWKNVYRMCVWSAREHFGLECAGEERYLTDIDDDVSVEETIEMLADKDTAALSPSTFADTISRQLDIPLEHANLYSKLVEKGLGKMEALMVVWGSYLGTWPQPEIDIRDILPADWRWR